MACSLCELLPLRAAAYDTVCAACFDDVCMQFMDLVMLFLFYSLQSFSSSINKIPCDDCVTAHIMHFHLIYLKHCKPACATPRLDIKFCMWWNFSWVFECVKPCSYLILLWQNASAITDPKNSLMSACTYLTNSIVQSLLLLPLSEKKLNIL